MTLTDDQLERLDNKFNEFYLHLKNPTLDEDEIKNKYHLLQKNIQIFLPDFNLKPLSSYLQMRKDLLSIYPNELSSSHAKIKERYDQFSDETKEVYDLDHILEDAQYLNHSDEQYKLFSQKI